MTLPAPSADALAASNALLAELAGEIAAAGGWITFARYMERALYTPGLGYYSGGAQKFGAAGDFVTAPELTPLFAQALARQVAQVLALSAPCILEVGAGSGRLAADLLAELDARNALPDSYLILELSGELRARQQATLAERVPHCLPRVRWLDALPATFSGLVLANELLDALPVHLVRWQADGPHECGVSWQDGALVWQERPAAEPLRHVAQQLAAEMAIAPGYLSEVPLALSAWVSAWAERLECGALLLIDYGFPRREYYHPQRHSGTLMCHYRHHAHPEPFYLPGLQDITAHVDFTAVVEAGCGPQPGEQPGLEFYGYTTQADFLLNCGLTEVLARIPVDDVATYLPQANAVQKLISPAEMGELFKVIAMGRGIHTALLGFSRNDRSDSL